MTIYTIGSFRDASTFLPHVSYGAYRARNLGSMVAWYIKARKAIKDHGLTYADVAARMRVKPARIGHWMTGRRKANVEDMQALAKAIGLSAAPWIDESFEGLSERGRAAGLVFDKMTEPDKRDYFPQDRPGTQSPPTRTRKKGVQRR